MTAKKVQQTGTEPVLRKNAAMAFCGLGPNQFDQLVSSGELPPPIRITDGGRAVAWIRDELVEWMKERIAARDAKREPNKTSKGKVNA
jgi:predicted DNA-binding transcriptional regulator AlpA